MKSGCYANQHLARELLRRKQRNPAYSLRAFARDLDVNPSGLSDFLTRKRDLSVTLATKIARQVTASQNEFDQFVLSSTQNRNDDAEKDFFDLMSYWHYFAILNLAGGGENSADPKAIAKRLAITHDAAVQALEQLEEMRLIRVIDGRMHRDITALHQQTKIPSAAIRVHYRSLLSQAGVSLFRDPPSLREMRAMMLPIDPCNIQRANDILLQTRTQIMSLLTSTAKPTLYVLSYYLFPATVKTAV